MKGQAKEGATARRDHSLRAPASELLLTVGGRTATLWPQMNMLGSLVSLMHK